MTLSAEHRLYLLGRGITPPTADAFGLASSERGIVIPLENASKTYVPNGQPKITWTEPLDGEAPPFPSYNALRQSDLIVEGEMDAIIAQQELGVTVASPSCGAGTWLDAWSDAMTGRSVTLLYDHDDPGRKGALKAAQSLHRAGVSVRIASWPEHLPVGHDVTDWFKGGGTVDGLREIILGAVPYLPPGLSQGMGEFLRTKAVIHPMLVNSVWPAQAIGFIAGPPKSLKSWMALELSMSISTGKKFLNRYDSNASRVLLVQQESSRYAFQRRVEATSMRYGPTNELFILSNYGMDLTDTGQAEKLEEEIRRVRPQLVVLDPFASFFSGDENSAKEVGAIVRLLRGWRDTYSTGFCIVHHSSKAGQDRGGMKMRGSTALYASAEAGIWCERKDDEESMTSKVRFELKEGEPLWPCEVSLARDTTLLHVVSARDTLQRNLDAINKPKTIPFWNEHESWETP